MEHIACIYCSSIDRLALVAALPPLVHFVYTGWTWKLQRIQSRRNSSKWKYITLSASASRRGQLCALEQEADLYVVRLRLGILSQASHMSKCMCSKLFIRECRTKLVSSADFVFNKTQARLCSAIIYGGARIGSKKYAHKQKTIKAACSAKIPIAARRVVVLVQWTDSCAELDTGNLCWNMLSLCKWCKDD